MMDRLTSTLSEELTQSPHHQRPNEAVDTGVYLVPYGVCILSQSCANVAP